jgi:hypothetical protein
LSEDAKFLEAGRKTADGLLSRVREDGFLAGRFDRNWRPAVRWSCLTGSVQIAYCWLMLFESTGDPRYLAAAQKVNAFVRAGRSRSAAIPMSWAGCAAPFRSRAPMGRSSI